MLYISTGTRLLCIVVALSWFTISSQAIEVKSREPSPEQYKEFQKDPRLMRKFLWEALLDGELSSMGIMGLQRTAAESAEKMSEIISDAKKQGASKEKLEALNQKRLFFELQASKLEKLYKSRQYLENCMYTKLPDSKTQARETAEQFDADLRALKELLSKAP